MPRRAVPPRGAALALAAATALALTFAPTLAGGTVTAPRASSETSSATALREAAADNAYEAAETTGDTIMSGYDSDTEPLNLSLKATSRARHGALPAPRSCSAPLPATWVARENANAGSSAWRIPVSHPTSYTGYASVDRARCGQRVNLYTSSGRSFVLTFWRMGWYGGAGGRLMKTSSVRPPRVQPLAVAGPGNDAGWKPTYTFTVPPSFIPGVYLIRLTPSRGTPSFIPLIVTGGPGTVLYPMPTHTWQAYNWWGGANAYTGSAPIIGGALAVGTPEDFRLRVVSYNRPYRGNGTNSWGDGIFLLREYPALLALEKGGLPVTYTTDDALDADPAQLNGKRLIVFGGHSEYMTPGTFDAVRDAVTAGTNVLNLGANAAYWRVRDEPGRLMAIYRTDDDPDAPTARQTTSLFRAGPSATPEALLWGSMYDCLAVDHVAGAVTESGRFPVAGSGAVAGTVLGGVVDGENDMVFPGISPADTEVEAHAAFPCPGRGQPKTWDLTYSAASGLGGVLSVGTFGWVCALNDSCPVADTPLATQIIMTRITLAFVLAAVNGPLGTSHPSIGNVAAAPSGPDPTDPAA